MMTQSKRPRIYLSVNPDLIPDELAALDRWVNWKPVWNKQQQRWDKPPVDGKTDRRIDCTKASNLKSLAQVLEAKQQAWEAYQKARELPPEERPFVPLYGIGFSLAKHLPGLEKLKGIDLDHCIQPTGEIDQWAREILEALRTYTEISPSGDGFHLLVKGDLPDGYKHKVTGLGPEKRGALEVYEEGRYLTITGDAELRGQYEGEAHDPWGETPMASEGGLYGLWIKARDLSCLLPYITPGADNSKDTHREEEEKTAEGPVVPDEVIVGQLIHHPLWTGDTSQYNGDESAADLALCNLIARNTDDPEQIDRIFRRSGLMRDKWDEKRASRTYGEMTIAKALDGERHEQGTGDTCNDDDLESAPSASKGKRANPWRIGD